MSATLELRYVVKLSSGSKERVWSQPVSLPTITLTQDPSDYTVPVAAGATAILWNPTDTSSPALPSTFAFLMLVSDEDVMIEFTCNNGDTNDRVFAVALKANVPLMLGDDASYFNYTATGDAFTGTLNVINKIRCKNLSADTDALVTVVIGN